MDNNNSSWCVVGFDTLEDLQDLQDFLGSWLQEKKCSKKDNKHLIVLITGVIVVVW